MATRVRSFSKINLGLTIGGLRPDGFHGLTTIYQTLGLYDLVRVEARRTPGRASAISLDSNHPFVPTNAKNTAWRMVEAALRVLGVEAEVHIEIDKRLPVQGGLGGGSANAVAALVGLERELGIQVDDSARLSLAGAIGSDVPLFLVGGTVLGVGRGEVVYSLPDLPAMECVIACPAMGVSTPQAFRDWDGLHDGLNEQEQATALTVGGASDRVEGLSRSFAAVLDFTASGESHSSGVFSWREGLAENPLLALVRTGIENDFEQVVFPKYPPLGTIKRVLSGSGGASGSVSGASEHAAVYAALSGSGSALFGLYASEAAGEAAVQRLEAQGIAALRTKTLPRQDYWSSMVLGA